MEGFKSLFDKFCEHNNSEAEQGIYFIVKNRDNSSYTMLQFYELQSEIRDILQNSKDCKILFRLLILLQSIVRLVPEEMAGILLTIKQNSAFASICHPDPTMDNCKNCLQIKLISR